MDDRDDIKQHSGVIEKSGCWDKRYFAELTYAQQLEATKGVENTDFVSPPGRVENDYDGCSCEESCELQSCPCIYLGKVQAWGGYSPGNISLFECNKNCQCNPHSCSNRETQSSSEFYSPECLKVVCINGLVGLGLVSNVDIPENTFLFQYTGELISKDSVEFLETRHQRNYIMIMKESVPKIQQVLCTCIDATRKGNISRFINHSCSPNLKIVPIRDISAVPKLCIFTSKPIKAGDQLALSYGENLGSKRCFCGSEACKGFLPFE